MGHMAPLVLCLCAHIYDAGSSGCGPATIDGVLAIKISSSAPGAHAKVHPQGRAELQARSFTAQHPQQSAPL